MGLCERRRSVPQHLGLNTVGAHHAALYPERVQKDKDTNIQPSWNRRIRQGDSSVRYLHDAGTLKKK